MQTTQNGKKRLSSFKRRSHGEGRHAPKCEVENKYIGINLHACLN